MPDDIKYGKLVLVLLFQDAKQITYGKYRASTSLLSKPQALPRL
jgi:hypothetical protein